MMLRTLREMKGISQKTLAEQIGWNQEDVSRLETGRVQITVEKLKQAAIYFDVLSSVILGEIPIENAYSDTASTNIEPVIWNVMEAIWGLPNRSVVSAEDIEPHLHVVCRKIRAANLSSKKQRLTFIKDQITTIVDTLETIQRMKAPLTPSKTTPKAK